MRRSFALLHAALASLTLALAAAGEPAPSPAPSPSSASLAPAAEPVAVAEPAAVLVDLGASDHFAFVADEDASLDHFLYEWARFEGLSKSELFAARADLAALPAAERAAWEKALAFYSREIAGRNLGFDGGLIELRFHLLGLAPAPRGAAESSALAEVAALLPSYRRFFWPRHLAAAQAWVEAYLGLQQLGVRETNLSRRIAEAFGGTWPEGRIRVDLSPYASWSGAYTLVHEGRPFATISSFDPSYRGEAALEMVFHEATHNPQTTGGFRASLESAFRTQGESPPAQLAHAVHFYTVGELARREAARLGAVYRPYAEAHGLFQDDWADWLAAIESHWLPFLDGRSDRASAVEGLTTRLLKRSGAEP